LRVSALLVGVFLLCAGQGLLTTLLAIRLEDGGVARDLTALVMTAYFAGWVVGSIRTPALVRRIGHIRAFATLGSTVAACALFHGLVPGVPAWLLLRFVNGVCLAGVLITVESWLNLSCASDGRGGVLSAYMVVYYLALGLGPLLLEGVGAGGLPPFALAGALFCLAVVPVAHTRSQAPEVPDPTYMKVSRVAASTPTAVAGALVSGLALGAIYSLGPVWGLRVGLPVTQVARGMAVVVIGGLLLQWPLGRLSDHMDRRLVIGFVALTAVPVCWLLFEAAHLPTWALVACGAGLGALVALLYPLSLAHASDRLDASQITPAGATLVLVSSVGAALGPLAATATMAAAGPRGLPAFVGGACLLLGLLVVPRLLVARRVPAAEREPFVAVPRTTAAVAEMDPRGD
jgi:MFS family permease